MRRTWPEMQLSTYKLHLHGAQQVRWDRSDTEPVDECTFFYGKGKKNRELGTFYVEVSLRGSHQQLKGHKSVSDRMSYIIQTLL
jgi:hypothetical protein